MKRYLAFITFLCLCLFASAQSITIHHKDGKFHLPTQKVDSISFDLKYRNSMDTTLLHKYITVNDTTINQVILNDTLWKKINVTDTIVNQVVLNDTLWKKITLNDTIYNHQQVTLYDTIHNYFVDSIYVKSDTIPQSEHEYVDLGLSVKWSTCNIGANSPEDFGLYFAWGETTGYTSDTSDDRIFDWANLKYCSDSEGNSFTKYILSSTSGIVDNKSVLESTDDAAAINWGDSWRMPTDTELTEIRTECYWEWTSNYNDTGVAGYIVYKVKSDSDKGVHKYIGSSTTTFGVYNLSDTHIFLPAAGRRSNNLYSSAGTLGEYWSSSLLEGSSNHAYYLQISADCIDWGDLVSRYCGRSVRPVFVSKRVKNPATCSFNVEEYAMKVGETYTQTLATNSDGIVTYSSSDPSIVTVDASTGEVTALAEGTATIIAYVAATDSYEAATASYIITIESATSANGHEYVDLGLSVKWATCNIGAENPEDYGDYFAWGETNTKDSYVWDNYKFRRGSLSDPAYSKYVFSSTLGTPDNLTRIESCDDAATFNWGGTWRIPKEGEMSELMSGCYVEWTSNYNNTNVSGFVVYKVKSDSDKGVKKYSGSSTTTVGSYSLSDIHIFFPAAGYFADSTLCNDKSYGYYWLSGIMMSSIYDAYCFYFGPQNNTPYYGQSRYHGLPIRPVCE